MDTPICLQVLSERQIEMMAQESSYWFGFTCQEGLARYLSARGWFNLLVDSDPHLLEYLLDLDL